MSKRPAEDTIPGTPHPRLARLRQFLKDDGLCEQLLAEGIQFGKFGYREAEPLVDASMIVDLIGKDTTGDSRVFLLKPSVTAEINHIRIEAEKRCNAKWKENYLAMEKKLVAMEKKSRETINKVLSSKASWETTLEAKEAEYKEDLRASNDAWAKKLQARENKPEAPWQQNLLHALGETTLAQLTATEEA